MNLIFAYGSNMHHGQLFRRCPSAQIVATGRLRGWMLSFVGHSARTGGGVATIQRRTGETVHGMLFEISDADMVVLDRFEGVPFVYEKRRVHVDAGGIKYVATAYVHRGAQANGPSYRYFARILAGAIMNDLPTDPVIDAAEAACESFAETGGP